MADQKRRKQAPKDKKQRPKGGDGGTTTERPPADDGDDPRDTPDLRCDCAAEATIYSMSALPPTIDPMGARHRVDIRSVCRCDPTTPGHCVYEYTATAVIERFVDVRRGWRQHPDHTSNIHVFGVGAPVNESFSWDRVDQHRAHVGRYEPKAPVTAPVEITLTLSSSNRSDSRATLKHTLELCVPGGDEPNCPEEG